MEQKTDNGQTEDRLNIPIIVGKNIDLCAIRSDEEAIYYYTKWMNDQEVAYCIGRTGIIVTKLDEKAWAEKKRGDNEHYFCIVEKLPDGKRRLIGTCTCVGSSGVGRFEYTLGICIGESDGRQKGYGSEAMSLMTAYAFESLGAHRVCLRVHEDNERAIRCYKRVGFMECGRDHEAIYNGEGFCDRIHMEITRSMYDSLTDNSPCMELGM